MAAEAPTLSLRGNSLPVTVVAGFIVLAIGWAYDRGSQNSDIRSKFESVNGRVGQLEGNFAAAVLAGQKERDGFIARFDSTQRENVAAIEALRAQQVNLDRLSAVTAEKLAVTAEKLASIAASITEIQQLMRERANPRRTAAEVPPVEAAAVSRVARREGMRVRRERGIAFVERRE